MCDLFFILIGQKKKKKLISQNLLTAKTLIDCKSYASHFIDIQYMKNVLLAAGNQKWNMWN